MKTIAVHEPGDLVAVGEGGARTAADLEADVRRVAAALAVHAPGEVILVCADRYHFAVGLLGSWAAGHLVRLPPNVQPDTIQRVASAPAARTVLHDRDGAPGGLDVRTLLGGPAPDFELTIPSPDRPVVTFMTSGSTGAHQSWTKTWDQLLREADVAAGFLQGYRRGCVLGTVPPHHIYGMQYGILLPLRSGAAVVREGVLHAEAVKARIERHGVSVVLSVPAHLAPLAAEERLPPVAAAYSGGAPLPAEVVRRLQEHHSWPMFELYGSTESGALGWRKALDEAWTTYPGATVTASEEGGLLIDSPWLGADSPRPFPVPDRIEPRPGGRFVLKGRMDGVVKVAGRRIVLREVEERLLSIEGVRDAAALAQPVDGPRGNEIWVAVVAPGFTPERVRRVLEPWFEPVTLPRRIRVLDALPREATGKLTRGRLRAIFEGAAGRRTQVDPEAEERVEGPEGREVRRLRFTLPADLIWFEGHFPGFPVLPGVAQLDGLVMRQVERLWPDAGVLRSVKRLKFVRTIVPGQQVTLELERDPPARTVRFAIDGREGRCASGTLAFGEEGAGA